MKKTALRLLLVLIAATVLSASPVFADLGLKQIVATQGTSAAGQAMFTAAKAVYTGSSDPAVIQTQLIAILNEAAETENETVIRYAIVAVMLAGGVENLDLSGKAISNSSVFANYESLTAVTRAAAESLLKASGGAGANAGGGKLGVGNGSDNLSQGGGNLNSQGGGSDRLFFWEIDPNNPFSGGTKDIIVPGGPATPT
jgi:hypothetical protein